jgi:hypothetical protein
MNVVNSTQTPIYPQSPAQVPQTILPPNLDRDARINNYPAQYQATRPEDRQYSPPPPTNPAPPANVASEPKERPSKAKPVENGKKITPLWMKIFLSIGVGAVGLSTLLFWAIDKHKIAIPKSLDFLPFGAQSSISQDDAKFADYMRKSIAKIDRANTTATPATPAADTAVPAAPAAAPTTATAAAPIAASEPGTIASTNQASNTPGVTLMKILPGGDRPGAQFELQGKLEIIRVSEKIGVSDWTLVTVAKGEAIVKKSSGEIRSIYIGQKF